MNARHDAGSLPPSSLRAAIDRACADLPGERRRQVVDELIAHLDELPREEAGRVLSDVDRYVGEMREAWGLEVVAGHRRSRSRLMAMLVAAVLVAAGVGAVIGVSVSGGSDSPVGKDAVVVPTLFGLTQDKATALLASVGLSAAVEFQPRPEALGTVVSQQPAEGVKVGRGSRVVVEVAATVAGPLLTSMPTQAVPVTQIAAINTGKTVVLYYAAIAVGGAPGAPKNQFFTVDGITIPIPRFFGGETMGICKAVIVFTVGVGGPGSGRCADPRQLARISWSYTGGYIFGLTSLPAPNVRIEFTPTAGTITVATRTSSQFSGLRFFIAKVAAPDTTRLPPTATIAALDNNGTVLLSLNQPAS